MSSLSTSVRLLLDQQLDWDNEVDRDLHFIADDHTLDWEEKLSELLEITPGDIHDIKEECIKPAFIRYGTKVRLPGPAGQYLNIIHWQESSLEEWKEKHGIHATYHNLLRLCCQGRDAHTAAAICEVLRGI